MKKLLWALAIVIGVSLSGTAMAADGAALFASKCTMCHGAAGAGTAMGPKLAGSDFIKGDAAAIKGAIKDGISGADKKHPKFALAMPKFDLADGELDAIVGYLKGL